MKKETAPPLSTTIARNHKHACSMDPRPIVCVAIHLGLPANHFFISVFFYKKKTNKKTGVATIWPLPPSVDTGLFDRPHCHSPDWIARIRLRIHSWQVIWRRRSHSLLMFSSRIYSLYANESYNKKRKRGINQYIVNMLTSARRALGPTISCDGREVKPAVISNGHSSRPSRT